MYIFLYSNARKSLAVIFSNNFNRICETLHKILTTLLPASVLLLLLLLLLPHLLPQLLCALLSCQAMESVPGIRRAASAVHY